MRSVADAPSATSESTSLPASGGNVVLRPIATPRLAIALATTWSPCACLRRNFRESRMREIRPSGLTRGEAAARLPLSYSPVKKLGSSIVAPRITNVKPLVRDREHRRDRFAGAGGLSRSDRGKHSADDLCRWQPAATAAAHQDAQNVGRHADAARRGHRQVQMRDARRGRDGRPRGPATFSWLINRSARKSASSPRWRNGFRKSDFRQSSMIRRSPKSCPKPAAEQIVGLNCSSISTSGWGEAEFPSGRPRSNFID